MQANAMAAYTSSFHRPSSRASPMITASTPTYMGFRTCR